LSSHHDELDAIKEWYRYNSYVRKKYYDALSKLPQPEIEKDRGASFPSLVDIMAHTLDAYRSWFNRYERKAPDPAGRLRGRVKTVQELRDEEKKVDSSVLGLVEALTPPGLDNTFNTSDGSVFTLRQMLWHLVEEELQHRGELNALLWQDNMEPPITDWLDWKAEIGEIKP
jgi:uncharacterized damage-inducible protein DinB